MSIQTEASGGPTLCQGYLIPVKKGHWRLTKLRGQTDDLKTDIDATPPPPPPPLFCGIYASPHESDEYNKIIRQEKKNNSQYEHENV